MHFLSWLDKRRRRTGRSLSRLEAGENREGALFIQPIFAKEEGRALKSIRTRDWGEVAIYIVDCRQQKIGLAISPK